MEAGAYVGWGGLGGGTSLEDGENGVQLRSHGTLPPHHLGGVHKLAALYSARREPQRLDVPNNVRLASRTLGAHDLTLSAHVTLLIRRGCRCGLVRCNARLGALGWVRTIAILTILMRGR